MTVNRFDLQRLDVGGLEKISKAFFNRFGSQKLLGEQFFVDLKGNCGQNLFEKLISRCGYENNGPGFFNALFSRVGCQREPIVINHIQIPTLYLYHLLETVIPGNHLHAVKTVDQLEKKTVITADDKPKLQAVIDQFPVRLSDHVIRQSLVSDMVAKQYLPFIEELDPSGHVITFDGHFKAGVLEQMYQNRAIFLLDMRCPVYCRFCFRKHKSTRKEKRPTPEDVKAAAAHVKAHSTIKEILITGGEPLLNRTNLETAINALVKIDHVQTIRIATRSIAYYPDLFLKNNSDYIQYLLKKNAQCLIQGKRIEIGVHFVHPDEVSIQSLDIISQFVKNGIQVYVQTPFLNGLNTEGKTLGRLFSLLRQAGAKIYYIFTPCSPIHGTKEYWTSISQAFKAVKDLRANFSDRCIPKLCTATPLGKIEWHTSGWAVEEDLVDKNYTWIRTPYTLAYFKQFICDINQMPDMRVNSKGTLDARFRVAMGDDALFSGKRSADKPPSKSPEPEISLEEINAIRSCLLTNISLRPSIDQTSSPSISRVHKTCLEMDMGADKAAFEYIEQNRAITDVVLHYREDLASAVKTLGHRIEKLKAFSHITCIRLCCRQFNTTPEIFTKSLIEILRKWNDLSISNPVRIEIETWFLLPDEILARHGEIAGKLIQNGVNIYANVPLIRGVNDDPKTIAALAHKLRYSAIEFHHVYVAGLDIQKKYNAGHPVDPQQVIDIASQVRKDCSGREIPLYIVQTPLGEIDFDSRSTVF
ncbi:MAG: radical SAM protein [Proteobacteria bacterium]|nr:radical SAM protein [Pseudomonadota bacterium]MBU1585048.1 radical SAM protein [Pseudomonadota bacterium]MBU2451737.1 radical SAM protein [Pseudomonadota bacterium]MBU2628309.1 radical SAM protein [Pseudomonadota bacterium]